MIRSLVARPLFRLFGVRYSSLDMGLETREVGSPIQNGSSGFAANVSVWQLYFLIVLDIFDGLESLGEAARKTEYVRLPVRC